uniref:DUF805 domain-containing protein n=1 Tax=Heterorhabditis bacteriophora TaxID=37862 RepID=A0A1I7WNI2_HETBA
MTYPPLSTSKSSRSRFTSSGKQHRINLQPQPVDVDGTHVLISIGRAILARILFIVHSMATIWQTVSIEGRDGVWGFALISLLIVFEGSYAVIMRAGDERKWRTRGRASSTAPRATTSGYTYNWEVDASERRHQQRPAFSNTPCLSGKQIHKLRPSHNYLCLGHIRRRRMGNNPSKLPPRYPISPGMIIQRIKAVVTSFNLSNIRSAYINLINTIKNYVTFYRAFILLNDRYIHPKPPSLDIDMLNASLRDNQRKTNQRKRKTKHLKSEDRQYLYNYKRKYSDRKDIDVLEEASA